MSDVAEQALVDVARWLGYETSDEYLNRYGETAARMDLALALEHAREDVGGQ